MPSNYAHLRFGQDVCKYNAVPYCNQLFLTGLHGPDILFFYHPAFPNKINRLGRALHRLKGSDFFHYVKKNYKTFSNDTLSYVCGVVCHYMLDQYCHPIVEQYIKNNHLTHLQIESSFDRRLMLSDGKKAVSHQYFDHICLDEHSAKIIAKVYGIEPEKVSRALHSMVFYGKFLSTANPAKRGIIKSAFWLTGCYRQLNGLLISHKQDPQTVESDLALYKQYQSALEKTKPMMDEVLQYLQENVPLSDEFEHTFGAN